MCSRPDSDTSPHVWEGIVSLSVTVSFYTHCLYCYNISCYIMSWSIYVWCLVKNIKFICLKYHFNIYFNPPRVVKWCPVNIVVAFSNTPELRFAYPPQSLATAFSSKATHSILLFGYNSHVLHCLLLRHWWVLICFVCARW